MNKNKINLFLKIIIYIITNIGIYLIIDKSNFYKDYLVIKIMISVFATIIFLVSCFHILNYRINKKIQIFYILVYGLFVMIILFFRTTKDERIVSTTFYFLVWIKIIFKNKIVFVNIIGNIILFIPLGIIIKTTIINKKYRILLIIGMIFCLELTQYFLKLGVFDLIDILLNIIGGIIGLLLVKEGNNERFKEQETRINE